MKDPYRHMSAVNLAAVSTKMGPIRSDALAAPHEAQPNILFREWQPLAVDPMVGGDRAARPLAMYEPLEERPHR